MANKTLSETQFFELQDAMHDFTSAKVALFNIPENTLNTLNTLFQFKQKQHELLELAIKEGILTSKNSDIITQNDIDIIDAKIKSNEELLSDVKTVVENFRIAQANLGKIDEDLGEIDEEKLLQFEQKQYELLELAKSAKILGKNKYYLTHDDILLITKALHPPNNTNETAQEVINKSEVLSEQAIHELITERGRELFDDFDKITYAQLINPRTFVNFMCELNTINPATNNKTILLDLTISDGKTVAGAVDVDLLAKLQKSANFDSAKLKAAVNKHGIDLVTMLLSEVFNKTNLTTDKKVTGFNNALQQLASKAPDEIINLDKLTNKSVYYAQFKPDCEDSKITTCSKLFTARPTKDQQDIYSASIEPGIWTVYECDNCISNLEPEKEIPLNHNNVRSKQAFAQIELKDTVQKFIAPKDEKKYYNPKHPSNNYDAAIQLVQNERTRIEEDAWWMRIVEYCVRPFEGKLSTTDLKILSLIHLEASLITSRMLAPANQSIDDVNNSIRTTTNSWFGNSLLTVKCADEESTIENKEVVQLQRGLSFWKDEPEKTKTEELVDQLQNFSAISAA